MKKILVAAAVALTVSLTGCINEDVVPTASQDTEVAAPAPEVTVFSDKAPEACLAALLASDELIAGVFPKVMQEVTALPGMIVRAAQAGMEFDSAEIDRISGELEDFTAKITEYTDQIVDLRDDYTANRDKCRG